MEKWIDSMLNNKISKEAMESQGTDKQDHFERKVLAHPWVESILELDPVKVEAEYQEKLKQEAMVLGKTAALDDVIADGVTPEEIVNRDYKRDVTSLSDYALAEMLAEARGHKAQNTSEMYYELKEKAKSEVASSREKAEKALLELIPDNAQLDWQKAFKEYTKEAVPAEPKEKDLYSPEVPEKAHDFEHPTEEKFKLPKDSEKALPGNGREEDERKEVTQEAGVLKKDIVEGTSKDASLKTADKFTMKEKVTCPKCGDSGRLFVSDETGECDSCSKNASKKAHCGECPGDPGMEQKGAPEIDKEAASNMSVIEAFINGQGGVNSMNLAISKHDDGSSVLINYETPIAFRSADGELFLNADKYSVTTSKIQTFIRRAAGEQIKEVSSAELQDIMKQSGTKPVAPVTPEPIAAEKEADSYVAREKLYPEASVGVKADACPVCGGAGDDMKNGQQNHMACTACGLTYSSSEIKSHASKAEVIKIIKQAEVSSPWIVTTDPETGAECIARIDTENKTVKESEESKEEELLK